MTNLTTAPTIDPTPLPHPAPPRVSWTAVSIAIVLLGVVLRLAQYLSRQSYWNDEASLLLNIFNHTARQLLGPLEYDQASPPLFLLAMRGMHVLLGRGELAMRLLPLVLGVAALVLFAKLALRTLAPGIALIVLAMFAVSNHLITHAAEAKQYSGDALVATLMLLLAIPGNSQVSAQKRLERVSIFACVAVWFSHPATFMFGGIALALAASAIHQRPRSLLRLIIAMSAPAASFLLLYFLSIRQQQSTMLFDYWAAAFVDYSWLLPLWLVRTFMSLFDYAYDKAGFLLLPIAILGAVRLWQSGRRELLGMLALPILLTLLAAAMKRYPFGGSRVTLFLAPSCLLLVGAGLMPLRDWLIPRIGRGWIAVPVVLIAINGGLAAYHLVVPRYRGNMRPVVEHIRAHRQPDEPVFALRRVELLIYWPEPDTNVFTGAWPEQFPRAGRFWVAVSAGQGRDKLRRELPFDQRGLGPPTSLTRWRGGAALFYDLEQRTPGER